MCLLDGEDMPVPGTMRATGDWVNIKDDQMYFLGRRDRRIKRNGKQVNLDDLQRVSSWSEMMESSLGLEDNIISTKTTCLYCSVNQETEVVFSSCS